MIKCKFENGNKGSLRHIVADCLVLRNDEILLVKRDNRLIEGGKWGLVGGFIERDETIFEGAQREIYEETGYKVKHLTLLKITDDPNRPKEDRQNVAFIYFCQADIKNGDGDLESSDQKWFKLNKLPPKKEMAFDHYENIALYQKYCKNEFPLPVYKEN